MIPLAQFVAILAEPLKIAATCRLGPSRTQKETAIVAASEPELLRIRLTDTAVGDAAECTEEQG